MERRDFIKSSCQTCFGIMGAGLFSSLLSSCSTLPVYSAKADNSTISVPENSFTDGKKLLLVRNAKLEYDILLVKKAENNYRALYMQCTHQNNPLVANSSGIFCNAHGSRFDLEGNVLKEPALNPLKQFQTSILNNSILINLKS